MYVHGNGRGHDRVRLQGHRDDEMRRKAAAIDTAQKVGVNPNEVPEEVMGALTRDYRDVMKAIDKRDNK